MSDSYRKKKDDSYLDHPDFKKKLWAVDDIVINTFVNQNRAMPYSEKDLVLKRYDMGIDCDEVFPNILVGNAAAARNKTYLQRIGVTHVLNCAHGSLFNMVATDQAFYEDARIKFKGLKLVDTWGEDIARFFDESAHFIDDAMAIGGKVLVHCQVGVSRSATIAIAYLMLRHNHPVEEAVKTVRTNRAIRPNEGFLRQLVQLDFKLRSAK